MKAFILLFILFNLITFAIFGFDKFLARANRQRISEKTLLSLALMIETDLATNVRHGSLFC
jgi:uncharacterized membrane protein YsdA (DUF1294 family)